MVTVTEDRSYSIGVEAQNADGDEITFEINVETAADLPNALAMAQAAVAALPAGYSADAPDEDE
jgi:hypothetical protein